MKTLADPNATRNVAALYAAHPVTSYGTAHEATCLTALAALLPDAEIVDPGRIFSDTADWLLGWPRILASIDALVVFADDAEMIGAGCLREIADAIAWRLPVSMLDEHGTPCELAAIDLVPAMIRTPRQAAMLRAGRVVDLAAYLGIAEALR